MKIIFLVVFLNLCSLLTYAQEDEAKIRYGGMQQLGIAIEANAVNAMPNLINGVRYQNWFAGIGIAYEIKSNGGWSRGINTMPVYLDARHYFFKKKWFFALADVGTNLIVGNEGMVNDDYNRYETNIGYYANLGCGIKARLGAKTFYSFDVSYNFKQTRYNHFSQDWQGRDVEEYNNFKQRRILIRLGIEI